MSSLTFKVDSKIANQLDLIQSEEGLGNRTSTFIFLIKYYLLTKQGNLDQSIQLMNKVLDNMDLSKLPSLEEQLSDL